MEVDCAANQRCLGEPCLPSMNRISRRILLFLAVVCATYATLFAVNLHHLELPAARSKLVWAGFSTALFFALAAWKFPPRWRLNLFALLISVLLLEAVLQMCGWLGLLPGVNTKLKLPYGRVYWTGEGFGNSVRNRHGWNVPEFDLKAPRRIAVIGDSFVEAVEVPRSKNFSVLLQQSLRSSGHGSAVLALGTHGTSPAQHIEVLNYAQKFFQPQEAIIVLYMGDLADSSTAFNYVPPDSYIYYTLDAAGHLQINPASEPFRRHVIKSMENCHRPVPLQLPFLLNSHCMTLQSIVSLRDGLAMKKRADSFAARGYARTGLNPAPFARERSADAQAAMAVMLKELDRLREICHTNGIAMSIVTIPIIPREFYDTQRGTNWTLAIGDYDYLWPDRDLAAFAQTNRIGYLSLANAFKQKNMSVEEIHELFLSNGSGHFSERGHRLCAQAVFDTFYAPPKP